MLLPSAQDQRLEQAPWGSGASWRLLGKWQFRYKLQQSDSVFIITTGWLLKKKKKKKPRVNRRVNIKCLLTDKSEDSAQQPTQLCPLSSFVTQHNTSKFILCYILFFFKFLYINVVGRSFGRQLPGIMGVAAKLAIGVAEHEAQRDVSYGFLIVFFMEEDENGWLLMTGKQVTYPWGRLALPWAHLNKTEFKEFTFCEWQSFKKLSDEMLLTVVMFLGCCCYVLYCFVVLQQHRNQIQKSQFNVPAVSCWWASKWRCRWFRQ